MNGNEGHRTRLPPIWLLVTWAGAAGLVVSLSLSGHATTGRWQPLGFIADLVHVSAASVWVGGLLVLTAVLWWPGPAFGVREAEGVVRRFSTTALVAVAIIVGSGVFQSWRQIGSWGQLTETDYGTVLLLKVTLVAAAVEAGWWSRRWVTNRFPATVAPGEQAPAAGTAPAPPTTAATPAAATSPASGRHPGPGAVAAAGDIAVVPGSRRPNSRHSSGSGGRGAASGNAPPPGRPLTPRPDRGAGLDGPTGPTRPDPPVQGGPLAARFRRWLALEAVIGIGVVALTGVLVDTAPPEGERAAASARAFTARSAIGPDYRLSVAVYPLVPGTVHVAIQLTNRATVPVDAFQVTAQLELPARQIGPLAVPLTHQFTGSWVANNVDVPLGGHWELLVAVLTDPVTEVDTAFHFTIYG